MLHTNITYVFYGAGIPDLGQHPVPIVYASQPSDMHTQTVSWTVHSGANTTDELFFAWSKQNASGYWRWDRTKQHVYNASTACQVDAPDYDLFLNLTDRYSVEYSGLLELSGEFDIPTPSEPGSYVLGMYAYVECIDIFGYPANPEGNTRQTHLGELPASSVGFDADTAIEVCPAPQWELDTTCEDNDITSWSFNRAQCPDFVAQMIATGYNCETELRSLQIPGIPDTTLGEQCRVTCGFCDVNQLPRCLALRSFVDVSVQWPACEALRPLGPDEHVTCSGIADPVSAACTGAASNGLTDCAANFALQAGSSAADCTGGAGAGCTYVAAHTPVCSQHEVCDDCEDEDVRCPAGCAFRHCGGDNIVSQYPDQDAGSEIIPEPEPELEPEPEPPADPRDLYPWIVPVEIEKYERHYVVFAVTVPSQPLHPVTINLEAEPSSQVTISPSSLTFLPDDWDIPRYVTIRGLPDYTYEGEGYQSGSPGNGAGASGQRCLTGCAGLDPNFDPLTMSDYREEGSNSNGRRTGSGYSSLSFFFPRLGDVTVSLTPTLTSFDCRYDNVNGSAGVVVTMKDSDCPDGFTGNGLVGCTDINECLANYTLADSAPGNLNSVSNGACRSSCRNIPGTFACSACPSQPGPSADAPGAGIELYPVSPGIDNTSAVWLLTMNESETRELAIQLQSQPFHPVIVSADYDISQIYIAQYDPDRSIRTSNLVHFPPNVMTFSGPEYPARVRDWYPMYSSQQVYQIKGQPDEKYEGQFPIDESLSHNVTSYDCNYDGFELPQLLISVIDVDPLFELRVFPPAGITVGEAESQRYGRYFIRLTGQPEEDITIRVIVEGAAAEQIVVQSEFITIVATRYYEMQQVHLVAIEDGVSENVTQTVFIRHEIVECAQPGDRGVCRYNHTLETMTVHVEDDDYARLNVVQPGWADQCEFCDAHAQAVVTSERSEYEWLSPWPQCKQMWWDMLCGTHCSPSGASYSNVAEEGAAAQLAALLGQDAASLLGVNHTVNVCRHHAELMLTTCSTVYFGLMAGGGFVPFYEPDHVRDRFNTSTQFFEAMVEVYNTSTLLRIVDNTAPCYGTPELVEGRNTTYSVTLNSLPQVNETVYVELSHGDQVVVEPLNISFDTDNWNFSQVITVQAIDDAIDEGSVLYNLVQLEVMESGDPQYAKLRGNPTPVQFAILDNDRAGLQITNRSILLDEGQVLDDAYAVWLWSEPTASVQVDLSVETYYGTAVRAEPPTLFFSAADWYVPQRVQLTAVDDRIWKHAHQVTLHHSVSSTDPFYVAENSTAQDIRYSNLFIYSVVSDSNRVQLFGPPRIFSSNGSIYDTFDTLLSLTDNDRSGYSFVPVVEDRCLYRLHTNGQDYHFKEGVFRDDIDYLTITAVVYVGPPTHEWRNVFHLGHEAPDATYGSENLPPPQISSCAGVAVTPTCSYSSGTTEGCPAGCDDDGSTCSGTATTPTCDLDPVTDGTGECPYGCESTTPRFPGVWLRPHDSRLVLSRGGSVDPCTGYIQGTPGVPSTTCPSWCTLAGDGASETCTETMINVALNKLVTASTEYSGYPASLAVDGTKPASGTDAVWFSANRWLSDTGTGPHWLKIDLQAQFLIDELRYWTGFQGFNAALESWEFQTSAANDDVWETVVSVVDGTEAAVIKRFPGAVARAVRLYVHIGRPKLFEIEVYGIPADTTAWLPVEELAHIAYVKDDSSYSLYINGELDQTLDDRVDTTGGNNPMLYMGSDYWNDGFLGYYRSVCTHGSALTAEQVAEVYAAEMARPALSLASTNEVCMDDTLGVESATLTAGPFLSEFFEGWGPRYFNDLDDVIENFESGQVHQWMIEIFNPTCAMLETAALDIVILPPGVLFGDSRGLVLNLCSGSSGALADCPRIAPGETFVLCGEENVMAAFSHIANSSVCDSFAAPGFTSVGHSPDGFHAFGLRHNSVLVDVFGDDSRLDSTKPFNVSDGTSRFNGLNPVKDHVLVRKPHIVRGNVVWEDSAGSNANDTEWTVHSFLGLYATGGLPNDMGRHNASNNTCPITSNGLQVCDAFSDGSCCSPEDTDVITANSVDVESYTFPWLHSLLPAYPRDETGLGECAAQMQQVSCGSHCSASQGRFTEVRQAYATLTADLHGFTFDGPELDLHLDFRVSDSLCERLHSSCADAGFTANAVTARDFCAASFSRTDIEFCDRAGLELTDMDCFGGGMWLAEYGRAEVCDPFSCAGYIQGIAGAPSTTCPSECTLSGDGEAETCTATVLDCTTGYVAGDASSPSTSCPAGCFFRPASSATTSFGVLLESEPVNPVVVTVVPDRLYLGKYAGWRDCISVAPRTAIFTRFNWTDIARFEVSTIQNTIDQGLFTNCRIQYSALSTGGDPLDEDYIKRIGHEYIEVSVSDDDIAGVSVQNIHTPTCINSHHPSCETKMQYTLALNEARPGFHEDDRPYSTSWDEHWSGGLIASKHTYVVEQKSVEGFIITTTTEDGVLTSTTQETDPGYTGDSQQNGTVNASIINSTSWYSYVDAECAPMDSFDQTIAGQLFSHDLANYTNIGALDDCAELCLADDDCASFDFSESTAFCSLGTKTAGQSGPVTHMQGFVHHDRMLPGCIPAAARCGLYNVSIDTQPVSLVTILPNHDEQISITPEQHVIDPRDWDIPVTFMVCVLDDFKDMGLHSSEISHSVMSDDPYYDGIQVHNVTIDITDDDYSGVTSYCGAWCCFECAEGANGTLFFLSLDSEPTSPVNVSVTVDEPIRPSWWQDSPVGSTVSATSFLSWTDAIPAINGTNTSNATDGTPAVAWHVGLPVTVHALDDYVVEGVHYTSLKIVISSDDPKYNFTYVPACHVKIHDNDEAGVRIGPTNATVYEAGEEANLYFTLKTQPVHEVALNLSVAIDFLPVLSRAVSLDGYMLLFNSSDWADPKTVKIRALEDVTMECSGAFQSTVHAYITSPDPNYDMVGLAETVYNGSTLYGVVEADYAWEYAAENQTSVVVIDNDVAQLLPDWFYLNGTAESFNESYFTVRLSSQPVMPVTVEITTDTQVEVFLPEITFDHNDWDIPKNISMLAVDDSVDEDYHYGNVSLTTSSESICFEGLEVARQQIIEDNDCAGLSIPSELLASEHARTWFETKVFEAGSPTTAALTRSDKERVHPYLVEQAVATDAVSQQISYPISLTSEPLADVAVHLSQTGLCDRCSTRGQLLFAPSTLVFTPSNWNVTQTVEVLAVDDDQVESHATDMSYRVSVQHAAQSTDPKYDIAAQNEMTVCRALDFFGSSQRGVLNTSYLVNYSPLSESAAATVEQCASLCLDYQPSQGDNFSHAAANESCVAFNYGNMPFQNGTMVMNGSSPCILHSVAANSTTELIDNVTVIDTGLTSVPNDTVVYHQRQYPGCLPQLVRSVREFCTNNSDQAAMSLSPMPDLPPIAALPPSINVTSTVHVVDDDCPILRVSASSMRAAEGGDFISYNLSFETAPREAAVIRVFPRYQLDTDTGGFGNMSHHQIVTLQENVSIPAGFANATCAGLPVGYNSSKCSGFHPECEAWSVTNQSYCERNLTEWNCTWLPPSSTCDELWASSERSTFTDCPVGCRYVPPVPQWLVSRELHLVAIDDFRDEGDHFAEVAYVMTNGTLDAVCAGQELRITYLPRHKLM